MKNKVENKTLKSPELSMPYIPPLYSKSLKIRLPNKWHTYPLKNGFLTSSRPNFLLLVLGEAIII